MLSSRFITLGRRNHEIRGIPLGAETQTSAVISSEEGLDSNIEAATFRSDPSEVRFNTKTVGVRSGFARGFDEEVDGGELGGGGSSGRYYRAAAETELLHG